MDYYRKDMASRAIICYSVFWFCIVFLRINALACSDTLLSNLIIGVCLIGIVFSAIFFIGFLWEFGKESIAFRHISSTWTWLMRYPRFRQAFVTGEYVGFRRLCILIIGVCIIIYVIPDFYQEGLMVLPALTSASAIMFIAKG